MSERILLMVIFMVAALTLLVAGCENGGGGPGGHNVDLGGVNHLPGFADALVNCTPCHGAQLRGGQGPNCYKCHNNNDHTVIRGGHKHRVGVVATCNRCHGPGNRGGLGPACTTCHARQPV